MKNQLIEQLIEAQLGFLDQEFSQADTIKIEFTEFYHWFRKQPLKQIWSFAQIHDLLSKSFQNSKCTYFITDSKFQNVHSFQK